MKSLFNLPFWMLVMLQSGANYCTHAAQTEKASQGELNTIFQELQKTHEIHRSPPLLRNNDEVVKSLRSLCDSIPKLDVPRIFPLKFEAKRDNHTLDITLTVQHTSNVFIAIQHFLKQKKRLLTVPEVSKKIGYFTTTSQETFSFDLPLLDPSSEFNFLLYPTSIRQLNNNSNIWPSGISESSNFIELKLHEILNSDQISKNNETLSIRFPVGENRVRTQSDNVIFANNGVYRTVVDLELEEGKHELEVNLLLWDLDSEKIETERMEVSIKSKRDGSFKVDVDLRRRNTIFSFRVLTQHTLDETVFATMEITMDIEKRRMSGILSMDSITRLPFDEGVSRYVKLGTSKLFILKLPYNIVALTSTIVEPRHSIVLCDKDGNKRDYEVKYGKSCTLRCRAFGTDIASISIIKTSPYIPPINSNSYVQQYEAFAIHDMGPASTLINGTYKCVVVTNSGNIKSSDMLLVTEGFPEIVNFTMEELKNQTARIVCKVGGRLPFNRFTIELRDDYGEVISLEKDKKAVSWIDYGEYASMTVLIDSDRLRYPIYAISCQASSQFGDAHDDIRLDV